MTTYSYYIMVSKKDNDVIVSKPYQQSKNMGVLCDIARDYSLNNHCETTIYQCFIMTPQSTKALYRFKNGLLYRL